LLFPQIDDEAIWSRIAQLCWHQHGGNGFNFTREDCLEMDWAEFCWYLEHQDERRSAEAAAIRSASRR
jgi:hypothetical protein